MIDDVRNIRLHGHHGVKVGAGVDGVGVGTCRGDVMDVEDSRTTLDIEQYVHVVKRQWRLILALTVAGLMIAVGCLAQLYGSTPQPQRST